MLEAVRDAYLALEAETAKVGAEDQRTKDNIYMIAAGIRTILDASWFLAINILKSSTNFCTWELTFVTPKNDVG
jgi:hypothetical protein